MKTSPGNSLSSLAKAAGAEELVITGELAEYIGSEDATQMIGELKSMLDKTQGMTDDEVRVEIKNLAEMYNVSLTNAQLEQVLSLVRKLEGLDADELQQQLVGIAKAAQTANKVGEVTSKVFSDVKGFFLCRWELLLGCFRGQ